jgi:hypothetical protein
MKLEHEKKIIDLTKEFDKSNKKLMEENKIIIYYFSFIKYIT